MFSLKITTQNVIRQHIHLLKFYSQNIIIFVEFNSLFNLYMQIVYYNTLSIQ